MCLCLLYHLWQFFIFVKKLWHKSRGMSLDGQESKWLKTNIRKKSYVVFDPFQPIQRKQKSAEPDSEFKDYIYNTFRIPAIVSHRNFVFAFCEGRRDTFKDYGNIDIVLRRGEMKNGHLEWNEEGLIIVAESCDKYRCMNPCPTVDSDGNIIVVYAKFPMDKTESDLIIGTGFEERVYCSKSEDNGETWDVVCDITDVVKSWDPEPLVYAPGPGHSIQMKDGSIVVSGNIQYKKKLPNWTKIPCIRKALNRLAPFYGAVGRACFIYSDNGGLEWKPGKIVVPATYGCRKRPLHGNESQAAEIRPGELYINSRTREPTRNRQSVVTHKNGPRPAEDAEETKLYEPSGIPRILSYLIPEFLQSGGCEGSVLSIDNHGLIDSLEHNEVLLVFSNPASKRKRQNLSVRVSKDCGRTWSGPISLHPGPSAYSDLVHISPGDGEGQRHIGCMYESSRSVEMERAGKPNTGNTKKNDYEASCIVLDTFHAQELVTKCHFTEEYGPADEMPLVAKPV